MAEIAKKRRRWPWVVLAVCLLLAIGQVAWKFRPLNAVERPLVGRWGLPEVIRLQADRRMFMDGDFVGVWSASETTLSVRWQVSLAELADRPWPTRLILYVKARLVPRTFDLTRHGPDRISVQGIDLDRLHEEPDR